MLLLNLLCFSLGFNATQQPLGEFKRIGRAVQVESDDDDKEAATEITTAAQDHTCVTFLISPKQVIRSFVPGVSEFQEAR